MAAKFCWCCSLFTGCILVVFYQLTSTIIGFSFGCFLLTIAGFSWHPAAFLVLGVSVLFLPAAICLLCGLIKNHEPLVTIWRIVVRMCIMIEVFWCLLVLLTHYASEYEYRIAQTITLACDVGLNSLCLYTVNRQRAVMRKAKVDVNVIHMVYYTEVDQVPINPSVSETITVDDPPPSYYP